MLMFAQWWLLVLGFDPLWQWWASLLALAIWYHREKQQTLGVYELLLGMGLWHALQYHWLFHPLTQKFQLHPMLAMALTTFAVLLQTGIFVLLYLGVYRRLRAYHHLLAWLGFWLSLEQLRLLILGGIPWSSLALSQLDGPLADALPYLGHGLTSLLSVAFSVCLAERPMISMVLLISYWMVTALAPIPVEKTSALSLRLYQPAHTMQRFVPFAERLHWLRQSSLQNVDLSLFPEGYISLDQRYVNLLETPQHSNQLVFQKPIWSEAAQGALLYGLNVRSDQMYTNEAHVHSHQQHLIYRKKHLVPLAENWPSLLPTSLAHWLRITPFMAGKEDVALVLKGKRLGIKICYDVFFADDVPQENWQGIVLLIDDQWYEQSSVRQVHLRQSRLYAKRLQLPLIMVANDGYSAIINAQGQLQHSLRPLERGWLWLYLPEVKAQPMQAPWLGVAPWLAMLYGLLYALVIAKEHYDKRSPSL